VNDHAWFDPVIGLGQSRVLCTCSKSTEQSVIACRSAQYSSMNEINISVGARASPGRKKPMLCVVSRWYASALDSLFRVPWVFPDQSWIFHFAFPDQFLIVVPKYVKSLAYRQSYWHSIQSPPIQMHNHPSVQIPGALLFSGFPGNIFSLC